MKKFRPVSHEESQSLTGLPPHGALYLTGAEVKNERNTRGCLSMKFEYASHAEEPLHILLTPPAAYELARMLRNAVRDYLGVDANEKI